MSPRPFQGWRTFSCAWCGKQKTERAYLKTRRFCGTSCSAKWRMSQPEIKVKVHNPSVYKKSSQTKKGKKYPKISKWWTENNPMKNPESREKARQSLLRIGNQWPVRGGNGRGPTPPQAQLYRSLAPHGFDCELVVLTREARARFPEMTVPLHYKIDIGHWESKIAVEVDGGSHRMPVKAESDRRKDKALTFQGWKVFRVTNERVLGEPNLVAEEILSLMTV